MRFLSLKSRDVVVVVSLAMFMAQFDAAVVMIALPAIAAEFGVPVLSMSLAVTIYLTMLVAALPISGWAADRFGPRRVFLWAAGGFALFSLACAVAPGFWSFILARALQGVCAALVTPVARLILLRNTPRAEMVDALAITAMPMLIAPTLGPSVGGFIVEFGRWEQVFLLDVVIAAALVLVGLVRLAEIPPVAGRRLDWRGALLLSGALLALLTGIDRLASGADRPGPWLLLVAGAVLGRWTLHHLKSHPHPIVALDALRRPAFRTTVAGAGALVRIPGRALIFIVPLMLQTGLGYPPFVAGLMLMALNGGDLITKPLVRPMYDRLGYRTSIFAGSSLGLVGMGMIALAGEGNAGLFFIVGGLVLAGISRSIVFTGMASLTFTTLDEADMASGNVVASISMQLFNALAVSGTALALSLAAGMAGRIDPAVFDYRLILGGIIVVGLAASLRLHAQLPRNLGGNHD